jgi:hypothetical protein
VQADKQANMATSAKEVAKRHKHDIMNSEGGVVKNTKIQAGKRGAKGKAAKKVTKAQSSHQAPARESTRGGYKS